MGNAIQIKRMTHDKKALHRWSAIDATQEAIRLYSLANSPHPARDDRLTRQICDELLSVALRFSIQARRVLELEEDYTSECVPTTIERRLVEAYSKSFSFKRNLREVVGKIIHARHFAVLINSSDGRESGYDAIGGDDLVFAVEVQSEPNRGEKFHVSPQGMAWGFLTRSNASKAFIGATFLAGLALATPAAAQTFDDAVRANFGLGVQLCLGGGSDMEAWAGLFRAAGFAERVERSSENSDTTHYFTAPADTVTVELYHGEQPEFCSVATQHMGVTDASAVLDTVVPGIHPGYVRKVSQGAPDPATGESATCVSYEDPTNPIGHIVGIAPGGDAQGCVANGTSQFYSSYRV